MASQNSTGITVISVAAGVVMATFGLIAYLLLGNAPANQEGVDALGEVLTNLAAVGSITAGFSLAAFAAVMSNTKAMSTLAKGYGPGLRLIVIAGQGAAVLTALACAVLRGVPDPVVLRIVGAAATGILAATVVITVLLMNSMLGWQSKEDYLP